MTPEDVHRAHMLLKRCRDNLRWINYQKSAGITKGSAMDIVGIPHFFEVERTALKEVVQAQITQDSDELRKLGVEVDEI